MKVIKRMCVIGAVVASFAPRAEVSLDFHSDISPLLVGGEEVGYSFFARSAYTVPDGKNQVVLRVSKLVEKMGEKEKFNSKAFVMTFDESNQELFIEANAKLMRVEQAEAFNETPRFSVKNAQGKQIQFDLDELPNLGGITRDHEKELVKYNKKNYPELIAGTTAVVATSTTVTTESKKIEEKSSSSEANMFDYWMEQANASEIEQFADIAFKERKLPQISVPNEASQPVQMLGYWFNKASVEEKKQILTRLISL
ncbi:DUF2057 domain-containing protein [Vibrio sp. RE86]|uniref:DUF2057 family protein n=1 Tax=Vibrio sp. RE86 TaxID=2607605 RepID=UPI001493336B|nr:DUF2057 family protein [Vibrio sp. RE86]NOH81349.1 DUF2057 domain-containing protein [Vibrio sp. RE86]